MKSLKWCFNQITWIESFIMNLILLFSKIHSWKNIVYKLLHLDTKIIEIHFDINVLTQTENSTFEIVL